MTLDARIESLEQEIQLLHQELDREKSRSRIANLMGRYAYLYAAGCCDRIVAELWADDPGIRLEEGASGVYLYERNGVADYYRQRYGAGQTPQPGRMRMDALTAPVIEVAADGRTAKGVWISIGHESGAFAAEEKSGIPSVDAAAPDKYGNRVFAHWVWKKYAADFLCENESWKLWHLHIYDVFRCPFDENWVTYALDRDADDAALDSRVRLGAGGITPEGPTTFHWQYRPDAVPALQPEPPRPYETFDESFSD